MVLCEGTEVAGARDRQHHDALYHVVESDAGFNHHFRAVNCRVLDTLFWDNTISESPLEVVCMVGRSHGVSAGLGGCGGAAADRQHHGAL